MIQYTEIKNSYMTFNNKDFIKTHSGLYFAVVSPLLENERVLCNLRYTTNKHGLLKKLSSIEAGSFLKQSYPDYIYHSVKLQTYIHAVPLDHIDTHFLPSERLSTLLSNDYLPTDTKEAVTIKFMDLLIKNNINIKQLGLVGSLLINAQNTDSDVDIIVSNAKTFEKIRSLIQVFIKNGILYRLSQKDWYQSYQRRNCSISFSDYVWHEKRKFNKFTLDNTKFDISCTEESSSQIYYPVKKLSKINIQTQLLAESDIFKFPARYPIHHQQIDEILAYTATYIGQVFMNEFFSACGPLEIDACGIKRIIVGTSREAKGEYIKVLKCSR